jgi:hypothetical protein
MNQNNFEPVHLSESNWQTPSPDDSSYWNEYDPGDDYDPMDGIETNEQIIFGGNKTDETDETGELGDCDRNLESITNDEFISEIFGEYGENLSPLICSKAGDPDKKAGWPAKAWPDDTTDSNLNWYLAPSLFAADETGEYRAKKHLAKSIHAVMLDDIGTKVDPERLTLEPSWLVETSPGNYQAGFIFTKPITDIARVEKFKQKLLEADLCDKGATGATARWMRMPNAINGRPKYGTPAFRCKLTHWEPRTRYTLEELEKVLIGSNDQGANNSEEKLVRSSAQEIYTPHTGVNPVIEVLKTRNLYKKPLGNGKHDITCPWVHEHTDQIDNGAAYFEPSDGYPNGGFRCHHSHGAQYRIKSLLDHLEIPIGLAKNKASIRIQAGEIDRICDAAEQELANTGRYFQRGNLIVNVMTNPETQNTVINPLTQSSLLRSMSGSIRWTKTNHQGNEVICDPPIKHIKVLFDAQVYSHLPPLIGLTRQPHMRDDDSVCTNSGYDALTGLFGVFDERDYKIPDSPTKVDAINACSELKQLLSEFEFADPIDEAAAISAMLTATIRPSLPTAPAFHMQAHQLASGKSFLTSLICCFSSSTAPSAVGFPTTDEECQKLLLANLLESPAAIVFDNLTTDLIPYKSLCSALTEEFLTGRLLGVSKTATVSTRALILSSGNNVTPIKDMARRCIAIHLDPKVETPASKKYVNNPVKLVREKRERYVSLAITIIKAWIAAGKPIAKCSALASYDRWSELIRQPLLWLDLPDPATRVFQQLNVDPDRELLSRLIDRWDHHFGNKPTMLRDAIELTVLTQNSAQELKEVFHEIADERGNINRRRLGRWIARHQGQVVNGRRLEKVSTKNSAEKWQVVEVK